MIRYFTDARLLRNWPVLGIRENGKLASVALLNPPLYEPPIKLPELVDEIRPLLGEGAWSRLKEFDRKSDDSLPEGPYHFVGMLGTMPVAQGRGHGTALLNFIKEMSRAENSLGITLSTETESNVGYYERQGFEVTGEIELGGVRSWGMCWRNPDV